MDERRFTMKKIDKVFKEAKRIKIDKKSKIVLMSDCHRGAGNHDDNFRKNQNIYDSALQHYYNQGFTYIELGDGDELWEITHYNEIVEEHIDSFKELKRFHDMGRFIMIYGNHDMEKKNPAMLEKYFYSYIDKETNETKELLTDLKVYDGLVLQYKGYDIFLIHGHQVDFFNSTLWPVSRFMVRHIWRYLERIGIKDPTSAAKNYRVKNKIEKRLQRWSQKNNKILVAGHTHRPIFPKDKASLYFNDGSCIHPNGITCIEIEKGKMTLVKWSLDVNQEEQIVVNRFVIEGSKPIEDFFKNIRR